MDNFEREYTTVWSFPQRANWASHNARYRGNFAPQVARNIILSYSNEEDLVLDPMVGSGTTLIECGLLGRKGMGIDCNPKALKISKNNLKTIDKKYEQDLKLGDARNLSYIKDSSVDLILTHPPYLDIIKYSNGNIKEDVSNISDVNKFILELDKIINELYRILKSNCYCAILIGDTRKNNHYIPLSSYLLHKFLENGFVLKEDIIKLQHNCSSTKYWKRKVEKYNFLLIKHEHLFVFRKPSKNENIERVKYSTKI